MLRIACLLPIFIMVPVSCASHQNHQREPASIESFPAIPTLGYLPSMTTTQIAGSLNTLSGGPVFDRMFFDEKMPFTSQLQNRFRVVSDRARAIVGSQDRPPPRLMIAKSPVVNAFVQSVPVCMKMEVQIVTLDNSKRPPLDFGKIQINTDPHQSTFELKQYADPCMTIGSEDLSALKQLLQDKDLRFLDTTCRLKDFSKALTFECATKGPGVLAHEIVLSRTLPFVFVNAGLLAAIDSYAQLDSIFAHELGHYYLGHVFTLTTLASYFYRSEGRTVAFRPPMDPALDREGRRLLEIGNLRDGRAFPGFFERTFEAEVMMSAMINMVYEIRLALSKDGPAPNFDKTCEKLAYDILQNGLYARAHTDFFYAATLAPETEKTWVPIFTSIKSCLEKTPPNPGDQNFIQYFTKQAQYESEVAHR